jgi:hypothetical protein
MKEVTITGLYKGKDNRGIIIGGKRFTPKNVATTNVEERVFLNLQKAEENGWFKIIKHNYAEFLKANGRRVVAQKIKIDSTVPEEKVVPEETTVEETIREDVVQEEVAPEEVVAEEDSLEETTAEEVAPEEAAINIDKVIISSVEEFDALSTRAKNTAIKNGEVTEEVINHIIENEIEYKPGTVDLAKEILK